MNLESWDQLVEGLRKWDTEIQNKFFLYSAQKVRSW